MRVLALGAAMMIGTSGVAIAQQADSAAHPRAEQNRGGKNGRAKGARGDRRNGPRIGRAVFRGIELTAEQKTQIQQINEKYRAEHRQLRERLVAARTGGERPDSAQRAAFRQQGTQLMQRQRAELRGVLTAQQQPTFDRNVQEIEKRMAERRERAGQRPRGDRPRGGRPQGGAGSTSGR